MSAARDPRKPSGAEAEAFLGIVAAFLRMLGLLP